MSLKHTILLNRSCDPITPGYYILYDTLPIVASLQAIYLGREYRAGSDTILRLLDKMESLRNHAQVASTVTRAHCQKEEIRANSQVIHLTVERTIALRVCSCQG